MKTFFYIVLCCLPIACTQAPPLTVHEQLRQHILEAELGSAITISFAKKPALPLPPQQKDESTLTRQLSANDKETRWAAAEKLSYSANKDVVLAIISAMRDKSGTQRVCVMAQALGHLKDPRALSALTQAAFDPYNRDLRLCAIRSIGMIGDKSAVPDLITALEQKNMPLQAANSLARLGDERAVQPLIDAASDLAIRPWMIRALGELGKQAAVMYLNDLRPLVSSKTQISIDEALWKITILNEKDKVCALSKVLLTHPDPHKRMWAAYRLGELNTRSAVNSLIDALQDNDNEVSGRAAAAIVRMHEQAQKAVRAMLAQSVINHKQRDYLYAILGYIGDAFDIKQLKKSLSLQPSSAGIINESLQLIKKSLNKSI